MPLFVKKLKMNAYKSALFFFSEEFLKGIEVKVFENLYNFVRILQETSNSNPQMVQARKD